jgi:hypothetical protein
MAVITLSAGHQITVDDEDADLADFRWTSVVGNNGRVYGGRQKRVGPRRGGKRTQIYLHRVIALRAGCKIDGLHVDHKDGNTANCRRLNLRAATCRENARNFGDVRSNNKSGYPGVLVFRGKYIARIRIEGKRLDLGSFDNPREAYRARLAAEQKHWGIEGRRVGLHERLASC